MFPFTGYDHLARGRKRAAVDAVSPVPRKLPFVGVDLRQPVPRPAPTPEQMTTLCDAFAAQYATVSPAERAMIRSHVQHLPSGEANPRWLMARKHRITGSIAGAIHGMNPYCSRSAALKNLLWPSFVSNAACRWGNEHEDTAEKSFAAYWQARVGTQDEHGRTLLQFRIENTGLVVNLRCAWMGMSPDGLLHLTWLSSTGDGTEPETRLIEYKCPYKRRDMRTPSDEDLYPRAALPGGLYLPIPPYYYAQIHWGMVVMKGDLLPSKNIKTEFVVWAPAAGAYRDAVSADPRVRSVTTPHGLIQVTTVDYDARFAEDLRLSVTRFWRDEYVPGAVWKAQGALYHGDVAPPISV